MSVQYSTYNSTKLPRDLTVLWANVGRIAEAHNTILNLAEEQKVDIVCLQEPWVGTRTTTQTNPTFQLYAPIDSWDWDDLNQKEVARPKVLTYVKKSNNIKTQQRRPFESRDLLWLNVNGYSILNVYRQPGNDTTLEYITNLRPPAKCLIGGDFNVHHDHFEPGVETHGRGGELVRWSVDSMMDFIGEPGA